MNFIVLTLKRSTTSVLPYLHLFKLINKQDCSWSLAIRSAGGFKNFCLRYPGKVKWMDDAKEKCVALVKGHVANDVIEKDVGTVVEQQQNAHHTALMPKENGKHSVEIGVAIAEELAVAGGENAVDIPAPRSTQSAKTSEGTKLEATNYVRYKGLLMDVGTKVMLNFFRARYQEKYKKPWAKKSGVILVKDKSLHLDHHVKMTVKAGKCEEWDITTLSQLLLSVPGFLKEDIPDAKKAVGKLQNSRNILIHSTKQWLSHKEFKEKWESVLGALNTLMDQLSPSEMDECRSKISKVEKKQRIDMDFQDIQEQIVELGKKLAKLAARPTVGKTTDSRVKSTEPASMLSSVTRHAPAARTVHCAGRRNRTGERN